MSSSGAENDGNETMEWERTTLNMEQSIEQTPWPQHQAIHDGRSTDDRRSDFASRDENERVQHRHHSRRPVLNAGPQVIALVVADETRRRAWKPPISASLRPDDDLKQITQQGKQNSAQSDQGSFSQESVGSGKRYREDDALEGDGERRAVGGGNRIRSVLTPKTRHAESSPILSPDHVMKFWGLDDLSEQYPPVNSIRPRIVPSEPNLNPYSPLQYQDSIRLLRLEPGNNTPIIATLEFARLSALTVPFEAISYVWGDVNRAVELPTETGLLKMTKNLHDALHRLRCPDKVRYIWADAVCIDQSNHFERSHQVTIMHQIYKSSSSVLIWLGPDARRKATLAFSVICSLASGGTVAGKPVGQANFYSNGVSSAHIPDLPCRGGPPPDHFTAMWESVQVLFECSWFWRVWCVQEIASSSQALVVWGNAEIAWQHVGLATTRLRNNHFEILQRYHMPGVFNGYLMYRMSQGMSEITPLRFSAVRLLNLTRQFECADARDRIYGLLGMRTLGYDTERGKLLLQPDYSLSTLEVYCNFAMAVLGDKFAALDLLRSVQHSDRIDDDWGSWMPRWDKLYSHPLAPSDLPPQEIQFEVGWTTRGPKLAVFGQMVSTVAKTLPTIPSSSNEDYLAHADLRGLLLAGPEDQKRLCWTLTAGKDWNGLVVSDSEADRHLADFAAYACDVHAKLAIKDTSAHSIVTPGGTRQAQLPGPLANLVSVLGPGNHQRYSQAVSNTCNQRRIFFTANGRIGVGPAAMAEGDVVVDFSESHVWSAFVLRQSERRGPESIGTVPVYRLVGECYMYDLMHGDVHGSGETFVLI